MRKSVKLSGQKRSKASDRERLSNVSEAAPSTEALSSAFVPPVAGLQRDDPLFISPARRPEDIKQRWIITVLAIILLSLGFGIYKYTQRRVPVAGPNAQGMTANLTPKNEKIALPASAPSAGPASKQQKNIAPQNILLNTTGTVMSIYRNPSYDFSFTYPAVLGEVTVETIPASAGSAGSKCEPKGFLFHGTFSRNSHIDFGYISSDYYSCAEDMGSLFETLKFYVSGNSKLKLYSWKPNSGILEAKMEEAIPVNSPHNISAYIFKNNFGAGSGEPVAIVQSPIRQIGDLIFKINYGSAPDLMTYEQGVELLKAVIKK